MHSQQALIVMRGGACCALDVARIKHQPVQPATWKRFVNVLGADKTGAAARAVAMKLYPGAASALQRVKDHNRAESLLIAHWLLRNNE
jgi:hypothetical protein